MSSAVPERDALLVGDHENWSVYTTRDLKKELNKEALLAGLTRTKLVELFLVSALRNHQRERRADEARGHK